MAIHSIPSNTKSPYLKFSKTMNGISIIDSVHAPLISNAKQLMTLNLSNRMWLIMARLLGLNMLLGKTNNPNKRNFHANPQFSWAFSGKPYKKTNNGFWPNCGHGWVNNEKFKLIERGSSKSKEENKSVCLFHDCKWSIIKCHDRSPEAVIINWSII